MLIQFTVNNFMSLKEETIISALAGAGSELKENLRPHKNMNLLPTVAIYGANAAGKSNIFKAITSAIMTIRTSNERQIDRPIPFVTPYAFDKECVNKPSSFDFIFIQHGIKYQYGFSADSNRIYDEYLYRYNSKQPSLIFERKETNNYRYTKANEGKLRKYEDKTSDNKLFLAVATNWNCELTKEAYMWFADEIDTYNNSSFNISPQTLETFDNGGEKLSAFVTSLLKTADINISGYKMESVENDIDSPLNIELAPGVQLTRMGKRYLLSTSHRLFDGEKQYEMSLPFDAESEGTKRIFVFGPIIKKALETGKIIIVDEIDNSLHPLFLEYLINLFNSRESNPNNAQLIFNTHSVETLTLDMFRRDQIYFVEKNNDTGVTEIYSLDEFSPRKTENIRKGYLLGRYGAIPNIGQEDLVW